MATLARGGRLNIFGFVLRLAGMVPFLFIGGRIYGAAALGRFAYAVLVVEFAAQIAALGLRRGLAQLLSDAKKPQACVVADALLVAAIGSAVGMAILIAVPQGDVPDDAPSAASIGCWRSPCMAIAWTDIALAALAYHHDVGVDRSRAFDRPAMDDQHRRVRAVFVPIMVSRGDGLIIAYVLSMVAALVAALIPLFRCYGMPHGWKPDLRTAWGTAVRNAPLAAADTVEWASRRIDLAVLGAFLPGKLRRHLLCRAAGRDLAGQAEDQLRAGAWARRSSATLGGGRPAGIAKQVRQVTYWIIAAQAGIALALGIPGRAVMGWSARHSPAAPRCSASCSLPKSSPRRPSSAKRR